MAECHILGTRLTIINRIQLEQDLLDTVSLKRKHLYAYANIHALNLAEKFPRFQKILNRAHCVYCDGEGVRVGARLLGYVLHPRIVLTYWVWDLLALFQERGISVFFLGGREKVLGEAIRNVHARFPGLKIAGFHHGYFEKNSTASREVVLAIEHVKPDVLFVCFGMPEQEYWIEENFSGLRTHAIIPAGSMIDYVAGAKKPTPGWMANHGLEWLFRLVMEPARLWKRYIIGNPLFIIRVLRQRFSEGAGS